MMGLPLLFHDAGILPTTFAIIFIGIEFYLFSVGLYFTYQFFVVILRNLCFFLWNNAIGNNFSHSWKLKI